MRYSDARRDFDSALAEQVRATGAEMGIDGQKLLEMPVEVHRRGDIPRRDESPSPARV